MPQFGAQVLMVHFIGSVRHGGSWSGLVEAGRSHVASSCTRLERTNERKVEGPKGGVGQYFVFERQLARRVVEKACGGGDVNAVPFPAIDVGARLHAGAA